MWLQNIPCMPFSRTASSSCHQWRRVYGLQAQEPWHSEAAALASGASITFGKSLSVAKQPPLHHQNTSCRPEDLHSLRSFSPGGLSSAALLQRNISRPTSFLMRGGSGLDQSSPEHRHSIERSAPSTLGRSLESTPSAFPSARHEPGSFTVSVREARRDAAGTPCPLSESNMAQMPAAGVLHALLLQVACRGPVPYTTLPVLVTGCNACACLRGRSSPLEMRQSACRAMPLAGLRTISMHHDVLHIIPCIEQARQHECCTSQGQVKDNTYLLSSSTWEPAFFSRSVMQLLSARAAPVVWAV